MKVYVVENVRPDMQVFGSYEKALEFAKTKAKKRNGPVSVWLENLNGAVEEVYRSRELVGESHINIYERAVEG